jgi:hypothetical protein
MDTITMLRMPRFLSSPSGRVRLLPQRALALRTRATPGRLRHTALRLAAARRRDSGC